MTTASIGPDGSQTTAIVVVYSRPTDFGQEVAWDAWYDDEELAATATDGVRVVTRWETIDRPPGFSSPVGFSHVAIYELATPDSAAALLDRVDREAGPGSGRHRVHTVIGVDVFAPVGTWSHKSQPSDALTGQVMAYVGPNDPRRDAEWNAWLDDIHVPDMLSSGAFSNATRWVRTTPARFGPNYLTIYDVVLDSVAEAVQLSGAAMGPAARAGRLLDCHAGGLRAALRPAGRYGAAGYRGPS